jgi:hypothetical protein
MRPRPLSQHYQPLVGRETHLGHRVAEPLRTACRQFRLGLGNRRTARSEPRRCVDWLIGRDLGLHHPYLVRMSGHYHRYKILVDEHHKPTAL